MGGREGGSGVWLFLAGAKSVPVVIGLVGTATAASESGDGQGLCVVP